MTRKVMERRAADNEYLHRDFHAAFLHGMRYVKDRFGEDGLDDYLRKTADAVYGPLAERIRRDGLDALETYLRETWTREGATFRIERDGETLVLRMESCPVVAHLRTLGLDPGDDCCRATAVLDDALARMAGLCVEVDADADAGACEQRFSI